jgi:glutaminase
LLLKLAEAGKPLLFTHADRLPLIRRYMKTKLANRYEELFRVFEDNDPALEWCENKVLDAALPQRPVERTVRPDEYELLAGFTTEELAILAPFLRRRRYQRSEAIINVGEEAGEMFFLAKGQVSVLITLPSGTRKRLATFSPGMTFGEMAFIDRAPRSALVVADSEAECDVLSQSDFESLGRSQPGIKIKLLENLSLGLCRRLRTANRELSLFD